MRKYALKHFKRSSAQLPLSPRLYLRDFAGRQQLCNRQIYAQQAMFNILRPNVLLPAVLKPNCIKQNSCTLLDRQAYLQTGSVGTDAIHHLLKSSQQEAALARLRGAPQAGRQHVLRVNGHAAVLAHRLRELVDRQLWPAQYPQSHDVSQMFYLDLQAVDNWK